MKISFFVLISIFSYIQSVIIQKIYNPVLLPQYQSYVVNTDVCFLPVGSGTHNVWRWVPAGTAGEDFHQVRVESCPNAQCTGCSVVETTRIAPWEVASVKYEHITEKPVVVPPGQVLLIYFPDGNCYRGQEYFYFFSKDPGELTTFCSPSGQVTWGGGCYLVTGDPLNRKLQAYCEGQAVVFQDDAARMKLDETGIMVGITLNLLTLCCCLFVSGVLGATIFFMIRKQEGGALKK